MQLILALPFTFERYGSTFFYKDMGDADWRRFEKLLDMSDDELTASCDEWLTHEEPFGGEDTDEEGEEDEQYCSQEPTVKS